MCVKHYLIFLLLVLNDNLFNCNYLLIISNDLKLVGVSYLVVGFNIIIKIFGINLFYLN